MVNPGAALRENMMNSQSLVRTTLWMSCVFNIGAAFVMAFPSSDISQMFELPPEVPILYALLLAFVVFLFGVIYGWLARQPRLDQPLLFVGAAGKLCFFVLTAAIWLLGEASGKFALLTTGDLAFGSIWMWWLCSRRATSVTLRRTKLP